MFGEMEAIDSLLQQLAYYKRHDPNQVEVGHHQLHFEEMSVWVALGVNLESPDPCNFL